MTHLRYGKADTFAYEVQVITSKIRAGLFRDDFRFWRGKQHFLF